MAKKKAHSNGSIVTVGLTQMACSADVQANRVKQIRLVEQAARRGAKIICTQELFASKYFWMHYKDLTSSRDAAVYGAGCAASPTIVVWMNGGACCDPMTPTASMYRMASSVILVR